MSGGPSEIVGRVLAGRMGLDPSSVGEGLIDRGVRVRMAALGLRSVVDYEWALLDRPAEVQALVEEVVVPESWFFRDDRPFAVLADLAREGWLADPGRPPLSALSLPCAGGEEPYSIAMTLLDAGLPADRFRVEAVDISARSLARAIAGVYGTNAFRGEASPPRPAYFREQRGSFTVDQAVRSTVRFRLGNLLDPGLFADRPPFDAVFCRNVLIYLDDDASRRATANLARLVVDGGLLFLGHADRLDEPEGSPFGATGDRGGFAHRKGGTTPRTARATRPRPAPEALPGGGRGGGARPRESGGSATPIAVGDATPPGPDPGPLPGAAKGAEGGLSRPTRDGDVASILDRAMGLADRGRHDEASTLVEGVIRDGGGDARAYFLLGLVAQAAGARDRAEAHYLKAIYLDPRHDEALLALALLARRKGDLVAEASYRRRADRVLARKGGP